MLFQSALPVRGATSRCTGNAPLGDFNPRSPCGERQLGDNGMSVPVGFQSTLPVWGATGVRAALAVQEISIHAPRVGSDAVWCAYI